MDDCIFCKIIRGDAPSWKVMENEHAYAFLDINPATRYHTLVIPKDHYTDIFDVEDSALREVISLAKSVADLYKERLGIEDLQVINSNGKAGQQDIFHIHYHVVPRSLGDGQNVKWKVHPEWRSDFDSMLEKLD